MNRLKNTNDEKCCGNCRYNKRDWTNPHNPDFYCACEESDVYGCNTAYTDDCEEWEKKDNG